MIISLKHYFINIVYINPHINNTIFHQILMIHEILHEYTGECQLSNQNQYHISLSNFVWLHDNMVRKMITVARRNNIKNKKNTDKIYRKSKTIFLFGSCTVDEM